MAAAGPAHPSRLTHPQARHGPDPHPLSRLDRCTPLVAGSFQMMGGRSAMAIRGTCLQRATPERQDQEQIDDVLR